jgi:serine/threonine protein phosphatase PrpC
LGSSFLIGLLYWVGENENLTYIGVFDGYDGNTAAHLCSRQLHLALLKSLVDSANFDIKFTQEMYEFDEINHLEVFDEKLLVDDKIKESNDKENVSNDAAAFTRVFRSSFKHAYSQMDILLARGKGETSKVRWSGATTFSCVIEKRNNGIDDNAETWLHLANCGDVEAIVVYDNTIKGSINNNNILSKKGGRKNYRLLTCLHTIRDCVKDRCVLEDRGCKLLETSTGERKINGLYSITRGLGFHGDKSTKKFISSSPFTRSFKLESNHICLIIATKGLWSALNYEQVSEIVLQVFIHF